MTTPTPDEICERLRANEPLPICPFDKRSPDYLTVANDKPCPFCGTTEDGPDKCRGADTHLFPQAADLIQQQLAEIERLSALVEESLYHLRLDEAAEAYHERVLAALGKDASDE